MNEDQEERLVLSFQSIAKSLEGLHEELRRAGSRYWPEPKPQREPVVSRIPNEEDKAKESLGIDGKPIKEWLSDLDTEEDDGIIGPRTAQWFKDNPPEAPKVPDASPEVASRGKPRNTGAKKTKSKS